MKYIIVIAILFLQTQLVLAQKSTYTAAEIKRLADLGRLWGMVNYFHPAMANGDIATDRLVVPNANALAADPSATTFKTVVNNMLAQLHDAATTIDAPVTQTPVRLHTADGKPAVHQLSTGYRYIALPTANFFADSIATTAGILPDSWDSAKGVIVDLRNQTYGGPYVDYEFIYSGLPAIESKLAGNTPLPELIDRSVYHNGMVPQENGENNIYYSGWRTATKSTGAPRTNMGNVAAEFKKPVAFIVNNNTSTELLKKLLALRVINKCLVVYEGTATAFPAGSITKIAIADGQTISLRTSDWVFGNNNATPAPDLVLPTIDGFNEQGGWLQQLVTLLGKNIEPAKNHEQNLSLQYSIPRFTDTQTGFYVGTGERLFALYNFWNAIRYFYPYKKLLTKDWNAVLEEHLPAFIAAKDSVEYNFALRKLISEIHDCHGFFYSPKGTTPVRYEFGSWPAIDVKFIADKLYVTSIGKDSLGNKNIRQWDEVIAIDGTSIPECLKKWRWYMSTSNEETYKRDIAGIVLGGKLNSEVTVKLQRNGTVINETLRRSGRYTPKDGPLDFNHVYPAMKLLNSNTGYVNMGALKQSSVDSMFNLFKNTKAIIMDVRNYPQGTAWSIAPRLTNTSKPAVKFHYPWVTAESIHGGEDDMSGESFFVVIPDTTKPQYKGRIIMLCNATTQSQAEYSIMMLQGATNTTVIGSQTAGADGNVTTVILPGNYRASFSGLEVLYPDGRQTQRSGIKVDIECRPTLKGLQTGRDELMERALQYLQSGK